MSATASGGLSGWWSRLVARWRDYRERTGTSAHRLSHDSRGLTIRWRDGYGKARHETVAWSDVTRLVAFKRDCFGWDQICLALELVDGWNYVTENFSGWQGLLEALPAYFSGAPPWTEWWGDVAFPAFAANPTELWPEFGPVSD